VDERVEPVLEDGQLARVLLIELDRHLLERLKGVLAVCGVDLVEVGPQPLHLSIHTNG